MLNNLFDLIKEQGSNEIINNPDIPNERNEEAVSLAGNSIVSGLQGAIGGGGLKDVLNLFSGGGDVASNGVTQNIQGGFTQDMMSKFGLNQAQAGGVASTLIPNVLQQLVHKTNDAGDGSFNLQGIFNQLSGGSTSGLDVQSLMTKFKSGAFDVDGDGDTDLQDVMAMFKGGGIINTIKGFFS
jgi:hypothetical protein